MQPAKQVLISKQDLGRRLREIRAAHGLKQVEMARILGVHQSHVSNVERGARGLTIQQVAKLSKVLRVPADLLLGEQRPPAPIKPLRSTKLLRCLQKLEDLPAADQRAVIRLLEGLIDARDKTASPIESPTKSRGRRRSPRAARTSGTP